MFLESVQSYCRLDPIYGLHSCCKSCIRSSHTTLPCQRAVWLTHTAPPLFTWCRSHISATPLINAVFIHFKEQKNSITIHLCPQEYNFLPVRFSGGFISSCNSLKLCATFLQYLDNVGFKQVKVDAAGCKKTQFSQNLLVQLFSGRWLNSFTRLMHLCFCFFLIM